MRLPSDDDGRRRIRADLGKTLFVEAGAGTGKTSCLVDRLIELLTTEDASQRVPIEQIAAITFTEKAAAELRSRLRKSLDKCVRSGGGRAEAALQAMGSIEAAAIETIHAFAGRILRHCAIDLGIPPGFEIRDEIKAQVAFDDWWERTLEELLQTPSLEAAWDLYFEGGLELKHLRQWAEKLHANIERINEPIETGVPDLSELLSELKTISTQTCGVPTDKLEVQVLRLEGLFGSVTEALSGEETGQILLSLVTALSQFRPLPTQNVGSAATWGSNLAFVKATVNALCSKKEGLIVAAEGAVRGRMVGPIFEHVRKRVLEYADDRRTTGVLEFQDLLILAATAARSPKAQVRLRELYCRILVDEFQDTDPMQLTLVKAIAGDEPGSLFFVGDPRQSIYRFRRADVALYRSERLEIPEANRVPLTNNFRSRPNILNWTNHVLGRVLNSDEEPLEAGREQPGGAVHILGEELNINADAVREREAEDIARVIQRYRSQGESLADIAILFPNRAILFFLERILAKHRIPFRVESKALLFETQEARDLFAVLRAIDDPTNSVAIVSALRSAGFGCTDQDLYDFVEAGGTFNYLAPSQVSEEERSDQSAESQATYGQVTKGLQALKGYYESRLNVSVSTLAGRIVRDRLLYELGLASDRPRDVWQRFTMILDRIRAFDESAHGSLREFLRWAESQIELQSAVNERIMGEKDDEAVRLMTIHAAKGLEFPIVIVAGLGGGDIVETGVRVSWDEKGVLHFRVKVEDVYASNTGTLDSFARDRALIDEERNRVLYVGCTRARDELVVSVYHKAGSGDLVDNVPGKFRCLAERIHRHLAAASHLWSRWEVSDPLKGPDLEHRPIPPGESIVEWESERRDVIRKSRRINLAATTISKAFHDADEKDVNEMEARPRGRGTEFGLAVHGALQQIPLATGEDAHLLCRAQAASAGISVQAVESAVRVALESDLVKVAAQSRHWKEVFASAQVEGILLEGIVDLLYEVPEGLRIIDYKTDRDASPSGRARAMETYRYQAGVYALILETTTQQPVAEVAFLFLNGTAAAVERLCGIELESAKADVRTFLRTFDRTPISSDEEARIGWAAYAMPSTHPFST